MARPSYVDIASGNQGWDGRMDDNFDIAGSAPIPIYENAGLTESNVTGTFPPAQYDRCFVWVNHSVIGYTLYWSDGAAWIPYGVERMPERALSATTSQAASDKFVRFTGAGAFDYDFLAVASWKGRTVWVRNDCTAAINLDPNGAELINGSSTSISLATGKTAMVYNSGSALYAGILD